ncbi:MAG: 2,3-bisphosphoglycerate-dependent phosphoglycerate mutase [Chlamydiae bacterium]|nr:2,3-bisphosphoglycerate-dependent phosphoglycerate mutase [Chlamydiota bacterium]
MGKLILIRHGQSEWNKKNFFTGWIDIPLSMEGIQEAFEGGREIQDIPIDIIFTSTLVRAIMTAMLVMNVHKSGKIPVMLHSGEGKLEKWGKCYNPEAEKGLVPVYRAWELNERMYGELQGMDKQEMREKYGNEQVKLWRRGYDVCPPNGESLKKTAARTLPYFKKEIMPHMEQGKNVLIVAHGNSLRSIVKELDKLTDEQVVGLEIPTGDPLIYDYQDGKFTKSV